MTDKQIEQALAVCEKRSPGIAITANTAMGKYERLLMFGDRSLQMGAGDAEYFAATTDPGTGYEAALCELRDARAVCQESNAACLCGCPMDVHGNYGEDGYSCENEKHECVLVSRAALAIVTGLRARVARLERVPQPNTPEVVWLVERTIDGRAHWLAWRGHEQLEWTSDALLADCYDQIGASRDARMMTSRGVECRPTEHIFISQEQPKREEKP